MNARSVTVSVVSHEHGDVVLPLLEDMASWAASDVAEVIITLNVPESKLIKKVHAQQWPFKVVITSNTEPLGYGANHNQAFALCATPFFCIVNPDIRFSQNPFPALIDTLKVPGTGCAYPLQYAGQGMPRDLAREIPAPFSLLRRYFVSGDRERVQPRDWINGAFMLFHSAVFAQLGGFDQRFFMYCEDVDICLRLQQKGLRLALASRAQVEHQGAHASRRQLRHLLWHLASMVRLWSSKSYRTYRSMKRNLT